MSQNSEFSYLNLERKHITVTDLLTNRLEQGSEGSGVRCGATEPTHKQRHRRGQPLFEGHQGSLHIMYICRVSTKKEFFSFAESIQHFVDTL